MDKGLEDIVRRLRKSHAGFESVKIDSINAVNSDGENMLHAVVQIGDIDTARILINKGIDIEQPGDLGHTPLHEACSRGNLQMVKLLVEAGADVHALDEGLPPFTLARYNNHDDVCDYLEEVMKQVQLENPVIPRSAVLRPGQDSRSGGLTASGGLPHSARPLPCPSGVAVGGVESGRGKSVQGGAA